ncbi:MAG: 2-oxoacid:acceptor oxidoreductase family protein, partial [Muribaculaceae bacterium]|nr:2-oxoacid:acceptor oxidoreductase family protein [Muribaculaceae bacterium]
VGDPDATDVIISMGSSCEVVALAVDALNASGYKVGAVKVRLYRPFDAEALLKAIPSSVKRIAVLDRTKEPGSLGEPLYLDVAAAVQASGRDITVIGGRYGLSSKPFDPTMVKAVFDNLASDTPVKGFTVGIDDDVTHLSLPVGEHLDIDAKGLTQTVFYGMGSDGTVGATKAAAHIIGTATDLYSQAYFQYSAKKSGGYTICQLRFGQNPIVEAYDIETADYIGCNKDVYVKKFPMLDNIVDGGTFVLNTAWNSDKLEKELPASIKQIIAKRNIHFYTINAPAIARANGLGVRINMIMLAVFFKLHAIIPYDEALTQLKQYITKLYSHEGNAMVDANIKALDAVSAAITPVSVPAEWANATNAPVFRADLPDFVKKIAIPCDSLRGGQLPVSLFSPDGSIPMGTTAYEKRTIADNIPQWNPDNCIECTLCSTVCSHAAIRPYILDEQEAAAAPAGFVTKPYNNKNTDGKYRFRIQVSPRDCVGCASCATVCPGHALTMQPLETQLADQEPLYEYATDKVTSKAGMTPRETIQGSQLYKPLLEFSGACGGCGETPYVKLLTQLMGERMVIAKSL